MTEVAAGILTNAAERLSVSCGDLLIAGTSAGANIDPMEIEEECEEVERGSISLAPPPDDPSTMSLASTEIIFTVALPSPAAPTAPGLPLDPLFARASPSTSNKSPRVMTQAEARAAAPSVVSTVPMANADAALVLSSKGGKRKVPKDRTQKKLLHLTKIARNKEQAPPRQSRQG